MKNKREDYIRDICRSFQDIYRLNKNIRTATISTAIKLEGGVKEKIGKLVEDGVLRWDLTLGAALPDIQMRPEYKEVTLEQLLQRIRAIPGTVRTKTAVVLSSPISRHTLPQEEEVRQARQ